MRLQDIMSRDIKTVSNDAQASEARTLMRNARVRHLLVLDGRSVVGILSDRDLGGRQGTAADLMTKTLVTAQPETTIRQAANLLRGHTIGCLVVMGDKKPVGIVTTTDLLDLIGQGVERPIERSTRWTLRSRGARGSRPTLRRARQA
jgi:CBS domain-containing protein